MSTRESTSLRLDPKEKALIAKAAEMAGNDLGTFIRDAARVRALEMIEDAKYQAYMDGVIARAAHSLKNEPLISNAEVRRELAARRRKK